MDPTSPVQKQRLLPDHPHEGTLARGYRYPGMSLMHHRELMPIRDSDSNGISQRAGNGFEQELYRLTTPGLPRQQIRHAAQALPLTHTRLKRWDLVCRTVAD